VSAGSAAFRVAASPPGTHAAHSSHAHHAHGLPHSAVVQGLEVMGWSAPAPTGAHYNQQYAEGDPL